MPQHASATGPVSVHFVNNVLAAAASYIEEDPDEARDALAELGAFLTHRLRPPRAVSLHDELEHVGVYLRLQQLRFPGRLDAQVSEEGAPRILVGPGDVQQKVGATLDQWLARRPGRVRVRLRPAGDLLDLTVDAPDSPDLDPENVSINLANSVRSSE